VCALLEAAAQSHLQVQQLTTGSCDLACVLQCSGDGAPVLFGSNVVRGKEFSLTVLCHKTLRTSAFGMRDTWIIASTGCGRQEKKSIAVRLKATSVNFVSV
jgi:hypothetical protein